MSTGYLYDGIDFVQEQDSSGNMSAAAVKYGVDELLLRTTSAGIDVPLADALGSIVAETSASQAVTSQFAYEPYGATTESGASTGNTQQYTSRENDATGLYYYRARYYSPAAGRFISQDPAGDASGPNAYAYAGDDPVSRRDPSGRQWEEDDDDIPSFTHPIVPPPASFLQQLEDYEYQRGLLETVGDHNIDEMLRLLSRKPTELRPDTGLCYKDEPTSPPPQQCIGSIEQCYAE